MTKQVYINGRFLTQSITGVQRVAIELIKQLDKMLTSGAIDKNEYNFVMLAPKGEIQKLSLKHIQIVQAGRLQGHLWEQLELPLLTFGKLLLSLCGPAPILKLKQIVTIHDAAVFANKQNFSLSFRSWYQFMFQAFRFTARKIITVSHFSKTELQKFCNIQGFKISVHHLGADHIHTIQQDAEILKKHNLKPGKYILAVSSKSPNKNFYSIIKAFRLIDNQEIDCAIVGGNNNSVFNGTSDEIRDPRVKYLGYVSDEELKALYQNAGCFVFPSFYEGFGLPPVEAMSCGCPVIVSNESSLPEVCGDSAVYCNPYDHNDLKEKMLLIMNNDVLRESYKSRGIHHSAKYNWESFASGVFMHVRQN